MIQVGAELNLKNLLSFRRKLDQNELKHEIENLHKFIKEKKINIKGPKVSTTYSVIQNINTIMDVEILIPIDNYIDDNGIYSLKKELKLNNCLKLSYKGNADSFEDSIRYMQKYIEDNRLIPISNLYIVNLSEKIEEYEADVYISINPNIT